MGLDWDAIRADYEQKASPEELGTKPSAKKGVDPFANGGRHTGSEPQYDRARIVRLYQSGVSVPQIAEQLGCHRQTIYNNLRAVGVELRDDRRGQKVEECVNGHPYDEKNTRIDKRGYRRCRACAREHDRRSRAKKSKRPA